MQPVDRDRRPGACGRGSRSVPPRCAACGASAATHTEPPATAIAAGLLPVFEPLRPRAARPGRRGRRCPPRRPRPTRRPPPPRPRSGRWPTPTGHETVSLVGVDPRSVPSWRLTTHTAPSPYRQRARPVADRGSAPTTRRLRGSMRVTVPDSSLATHSAPAPATIALGFAPTGIVRVTRPRARSRRRMRPSTPEATHSAPAATPASAARCRPAIRCTTLFGAGIDLRDLARVAVGHPQRAAAERERRRRAADRDRHPIVARRARCACTVPSAALAIQTEPPPSTTALGLSPTAYLLRDVTALRIDQPDASSRRCLGGPRARARG